MKNIIITLLSLLPLMAFSQLPGNEWVWNFQTVNGQVVATLIDSTASNQAVISKTFAPRDTVSAQTWIAEQGRNLYQIQAARKATMWDDELSFLKLRAEARNYGIDNFIAANKAYLGTQINGSYTYTVYSVDNVSGAVKIPVTISNWEIRNANNNALLATINPYSWNHLEVTVRAGAQTGLIFFLSAQVTGEYKGHKINTNNIDFDLVTLTK